MLRASWDYTTGEEDTDRGLEVTDEVDIAPDRLVEFHARELSREDQPGTIHVKTMDMHPLVRATGQSRDQQVLGKAPRGVAEDLKLQILAEPSSRSKPPPNTTMLTPTMRLPENLTVWPVNHHILQQVLQNILTAKLGAR